VETAIVMPRSFSFDGLSMSSTLRFWILVFSVLRQLMCAAALCGGLGALALAAVSRVAAISSPRLPR
jgi:hypothetical protein